MILESRNFEQFIVKKFVRQERMFFTNDDGLLELNHQEIIESNKIKLPNYMEVVESIDYDFGVMRIRKGRVEILSLMSKSEESRNETARILSEYDPKRKVEVVLLDGMYNRKELELIKKKVRPEVEALIRSNNKTYSNVDHINFAVLKEAIRVYTDNYCQDCGVKQEKLDIHHILPEEYDGAHFDENNLTGICGGREKGRLKRSDTARQACHDKWQNKAKEESILFPGVFSLELARFKERGKGATEINENLSLMDSEIGVRDRAMAY